MKGNQHTPCHGEGATRAGHKTLFSFDLLEMPELLMFCVLIQWLTLC